MYKIINVNNGDTIFSLIKRIDSQNFVSYIPMNESNVDYQKYLEWLAEGNTPEPADE
jgi:hypothetical protein